MKNKIVKLKLFQEKAVFRVPYSMEVVETYPLPPYSTILGLIHNVLLSPTTIEGINISIQGKYGSLSREYVSYHKYKKDDREGRRYPIIITTLVDLELVIHIKLPNEEIHNRFLSSFSSPPYFLYLGRPEDLIVKSEIYEDEEIEFNPSETEKGGINLPYNCYIPFNIAYDLELEGIYYLIPSYYRLLSESKKKGEFKETFRNFEMIKVKYVHAGQTIIKRIILDKSENTPIWWMR